MKTLNDKVGEMNHMQNELKALTTWISEYVT